MSELFREIEEDMRAERMHNLWSRFGRAAIWVSVAIVLGTAGGVLWKQYNKSENAKSTSELLAGMQALSADKSKEAIAQFDKLAGKPGSAHWRIAMLQKAHAQRDAGDREGAIKSYGMLAKDSSSKGDQAFIDLAQLDASILSGTEIKPVKDSPFYYTLSEWKAWQLVKEGKKDEAAAIFAELAQADEAPGTLRERALLAEGYLKLQTKAERNNAQ
jgi:hypothetical protein